MALPANLPPWFKKAFPTGLKNWFGRLLICVIGRILRIIVRFWKSFRIPGTRLVVVTGFDLVQEVFSRWDAFPVPHDSKTDALRWEPPFLLSRRDLNDEYVAMRGNTREIFAEGLMEDLSAISLQAFQARLPSAGVDGADFDLMWDYTYPAFLQIIRNFYGLNLPEDEDTETGFVCALLVISGFFFGKAHRAEAPQHVLQAYRYARNIIEVRVEHWKTNTGAQGAMARAVAKNALGVDDLTSYFLGMTLGFVPTSGNAHGRIFDTLFKRTDAMEWARRYVGGADDDRALDAELLSVLHESLRMNYILPGLWRTAPQSARLGRGLDVEREIRAGDTLLASTMAGMYDPARHDEPRQFRPDRSYWGYLNFGHQMHYCVGWDMANTIMLESFRPLIRRNFIRKPHTRSKWRGEFPWVIKAHLPGN